MLQAYLPVMLQLADFDQWPSLDLVLLVVAVNILSNALPELLDSMLSDADGAPQQCCDLVVHLQQSFKRHASPPTKQRSKCSWTNALLYESLLLTSSRSAFAIVKAQI